MDAFRYEQFCPLARAAEIVGHRWVLPILRELMLGPQRFSDLRRRLPGMSSSILADRLSALETQGIVTRRALRPPAASTVYELTPDGRALDAVLIELTRWGVRFLTKSSPGDHVEPDWLTLAVTAFGRRDAAPDRRLEIRPYSETGEAIVRFAGGTDGTHLLEDDAAVDATLKAPVVVMMGLMSGRLPVAAALASDEVQLEGDAEAIADLPDFFEMTF